MRGLVNKLVSRSLSVAGKWQHQQLRRLNIHEYQGAELMRKYGVNVPKGVAVSSLDEVKKAIQDVFPNESELVLKSQILAGGRGLGTFKSGLKGGVHIVSRDQVEDIAGKMLGQVLVTKQTGPQGKVVSKVYLCEKLSLVNEMYFSIILDRNSAGPLIIACKKGGTSIEDLTEKFPDMIIKVPIDVFTGITDEDAAKVVDGLAPKAADGKDSIEQVKKLYELFRKSDCTMLEINPLAETSTNQLVAADAKLNFDDNATFRQKEVFALRDPTQEDPHEASSSVKDKISAATEEVNGSFKFGKEENAESASSSGTGTSDGEKQQQPGATEEQHILFGKFKSTIVPQKVSEAFHKLREVKALDLAKKGLDIVKDELQGSSTKKKHLEYTPPPPFTGERSTRTDLVITPTKQSKWQKKWESLREKMQGYPVFKRLSGMSEPLVNKSQEIAEDVREIWETSDTQLFTKFRNSASTFKEIRRRDPSFSLPDFAAEVQEAIRPVLNAYSKGDAKTLRKYCSNEVIERCTAELAAFQSHGFFFDNKLLHISEIDVREAKMMGTSPIILVGFQTQQIFCVRDKDGKIKEGGEDTIHTVYYEWAMQQVEAEELGEGAIYPIWRLRDMRKAGVQALI